MAASLRVDGVKNSIRTRRCGTARAAEYLVPAMVVVVVMVEIMVVAAAAVVVWWWWQCDE